MKISLLEKSLVSKYSNDTIFYIGEDSENILTQFERTDFYKFNFIYFSNDIGFSGDLSIKCLADTIKKFPNIKGFCLGGDKITDFGIQYLSKILHNNVNITGFYLCIFLIQTNKLDGYNITDLGAKYISEINIPNLQKFYFGIFQFVKI